MPFEDRFKCKYLSGCQTSMKKVWSVCRCPKFSCNSWRKPTKSCYIIKNYDVMKLNESAGSDEQQLSKGKKELILHSKNNKHLLYEMTQSCDERTVLIGFICPTAYETSASRFYSCVMEEWGGAMMGSGRWAGLEERCSRDGNSWGGLSIC